ncbi:hypothetical protein Tco_0786834 [Tanacetum coccineum]
MSEQMINHVNDWEKANQEKNNESLTIELKRYKERVKTFEQCLHIDLSTREKMIDSQMDYMIKEKLALKKQINSLEQNLSNQIKEKESLLQTFTVLKNKSKEKESKYMDKEIDLEKKIKELDNIVYKVGQSAQIVHIVISSQHVAIPVIDDEETLILEELQTSRPNTDPSASSPVKIEAPKELPKVSLVNTSLKKLRYHLGQFDAMVKKRITPDAITEGEWGFEHTKTIFLNEIIPFLKTLKDIFNVFDKDILNEDSSSDNQNALEIPEYFENNALKAQLQAKDTTICKLKENIKSMRENDKEEKFKHDMDEIETINIELEHKRARKQNPSKPLLDSACKFTKHVQELLVYVSQTRPSFTKPSEKLVAVTPMNKVKKVRFLEPLTSSRNIHKQVESSKTPDSNTPVFPSIGMKSSTSASRSQPTCNKKNDRISQTPSSNMKNKVYVQRRRVNLSYNKKNHVKDRICNAKVKHTMLNANSELICVKCNQCMFDAYNDVCFLDFMNNVNVRSKSKSTSTKVVPIKETTSHLVETQKLEIKVYSRRPKQVKSVGSSKKPKIVESKIANNSEPNHLWGSDAKDVLSSSSLVNDRHNLFSVGQFCDADLEIAFQKNTCFIRNLEGVDLLLGSKDTNLYTISLDEMLKTSSICLLSKALKTKSWLWHHQLSHLNFACALGKSKKSSHKPKAEDTNQEKFYLLHMDLCGPMRVQGINGRRAVEIATTPSSTTIDQDAPSSSTSLTNQQQQSSIISQGVEEPIPNALFDNPCHEP